MELLWETSPRTSAELCAALERTRRWKRATVMTLLGRLIAKGVVNTEEEGRRWSYAAAVPRESCVAQETRGFLDRLFKGALLPMVGYRALFAGAVVGVAVLVAAAAMPDRPLTRG